MRNLQISTAFILLSLLVACNTNQQLPVVTAPAELDYWAKDNLDLQRVGNLLEKSETPAEFEAYLNEDGGVNNLDLNGDGYVDYISVEEFDDRTDLERGISLYTHFGPGHRQEVATVVLYRDVYEAPGARILVTGNDNLYGDNVYYETNWVDRTVNIVSFLFRPREVYYHSPYYYEYYPDDYVVYQVVETPIYRTRIERLYPEPVFVFTTAPTFISKVKIKSPNYGKSFARVFAKLAKPSREQIEFRRNDPARPVHVKFENPGKRGDAPGQDKFQQNDKGHGPDKIQGHDRQPKEVKQNDQGPGKASKPPQDQQQGGKPAGGKPPAPADQGKGKKKG